MATSKRGPNTALQLITCTTTCMQTAATSTAVSMKSIAQSRSWHQRCSITTVSPAGMRYQLKSGNTSQPQDTRNTKIRREVQSRTRPVQTPSFADLLNRNAKSTIRKVKTFIPTHTEEADPVRYKTKQHERPNFLKGKAMSVMKRRARAASMSSMTSAEKAAFDDIWKLFEPVSKPPVPAEQQPVDPNDTDYRNLLSLFETLARNDESDRTPDTPSVTPDSAHDLPQRQPETQEVQEVEEVQHMPHSTNDLPAQSDIDSADSTDNIAMTLVEDISTCFNEALRSNSPEQLWENLEQKVFPLTKLLIPSRSKLSTKTMAFSDHPPVPPPQHPLIPQGTPLIPLLSKVYPTVLLLALRLYARHHPTSPYCLSLLPHIKSLGPTSYVLGANTHFYNTLLSVRWDYYSDLDEISLLLAEMDRTGLEYDSSTADILRRISEERDLDLRGELVSYGSRPGKITRGAEWWRKPLVNRSWNRFKYWKGVVARRLEGQGLGEVMREGDLLDLDLDVDALDVEYSRDQGLPVSVPGERTVVTL